MSLQPAPVRSSIRCSKSRFAFASDIFDYEAVPGCGIFDYLTTPLLHQVEGIVTNPPFRLALQGIAEHDQDPRGVCNIDRQTALRIAGDVQTFDRSREGHGGPVPLLVVAIAVVCGCTFNLNAVILRRGLRLFRRLCFDRDADRAFVAHADRNALAVLECDVRTAMRGMNSKTLSTGSVGAVNQLGRLACPVEGDRPVAKVDVAAAAMGEAETAAMSRRNGSQET